MKKKLGTTLSFLLLLFNLCAQSGIKDLIDEVEQITQIEDLNNLESKYKSKPDLEKEVQLILDFKRSKFSENPVKELEILFELTNNSNSFSNYTKAWSNYHLSNFLLHHNIKQEGIKRNKLSYYYAKKSHFTRVEINTISILAGYYYTEKEFQKAINYYNKCSFTDRISKASNFNNLALSHMNLKNYDLSFYYFNIGLSTLRNPRNENEKEVLFLIKGNMGTLFIEKGDTKNAEIYLKEEYDYYENKMLSEKKLKNNHLRDYLYSISELIKLKSLKNQNYSQLFEEMLTYFSKIRDLQIRFEVIDKLNSKLLKYISRSEINRLYIVQNHVQKKYIKYDNKSKDFIMKLLYEDKLKSLKKTAKYEHYQNYLTKKNNQFKSILILILIGLLILISTLFIKIQRHRKFQEQHDLIVNLQKEELYETNQRLLQNEINNRKEQLQELSIGLKIKKETEVNLLSKIKILKKKPNASIEMVINEIYLGIQNLTEIDKKLFISQTENSNDLIVLKNRLKELHSDLSKNQLEFCHFCLLGLSSKEIGHITGQTDGAVRAYKSKIKVKIGLKNEDDLQEYLNQVCFFIK